MNVARKRLEVIDGGGGATGSGAGGGDGSPQDQWRRQLVRNKDQRPESTLHNLLLILENDELFAGLFWLNESSNQVLLTRLPPWASGRKDEFTDADSCELAAWLQHPETYGMAASDELCLKAVLTAARRYKAHPIRDYLQGLVWDGEPRVERMLVDLFGADDRTYTLQASTCFMVSAVSRILWVDPKQPFVGSKVDFMLVLEGRQGKRKTTALEALFSASWYVETLESPAGKDFYQVIQGAWGIEIAEMDSFTKADVTAVKGAITRRVDKFRAPYERMPKSYRRQCVFVGTTNESEYLRDHTGGRRFLPVRVRDDCEIDLDAIRAARDQLWAEAVHLFNQGVAWWKLPDDTDEEQESRYFEDSWERLIARWLRGEAPGENAYPLSVSDRYRRWVTTDELLLHALGVDIARHDRPAQMRVAHAMKRAGWTHERVRLPEGGRERRWVSASLNVGGGPPAGPRVEDDDVPF